MQVSEQLTNFLTAQSEQLPHAADLINRVIVEIPSLEMQVNVAQDDGEPVAGKRHTYSNMEHEWHSVRIPRDAFSTPNWNDYHLRYPIGMYASDIGSTGWNWEQRSSRWVGFDFDAITGHAEGVGISDAELAAVRRQIEDLPYVELRKSTSGQGLHAYVHVTGFTTQNHTEHAAVAKAILAKMSEDATFNFASSVDVCGAILWIWSRRVSVENQGLALIKSNSETLDSAQVPNWEDYMDVVARRRSKVAVRGVSPDDEDEFEELSAAHRRVELDDEHKRLRDYLSQQDNLTSVWFNDRGMLQTHTKALEKAHAELELEGFFATNSPGTDLSTPNCFMFPQEKGVWRVFRFGPGTVEHKTWRQDGASWTCCLYNAKPDLNTAAVASGGRPLKKGGYEIDTLEKAAGVIQTLSNDPTYEFHVPPALAHRATIIGSDKEGRVTLTVKASDGDPKLENWNSADLKGHHTFVAPVSAGVSSDSYFLDYDETVRCTETTNGTPAGWLIRKGDGEWTHKSASSVKHILQFNGNTKGEAEIIMGRAELRPWKLVTNPFGEEYPGNRCWNFQAPQLAYRPSDEEGPHPHWDMIMSHVGSDLDKHVRKLDWAKACGITSGADYLNAWFANLIRNPLERLAYLFLYGGENTGKSILHGAFDLLVKNGGVVMADRALTSSSDFNGELAGCVLAVVEEKNIAKHKGAHAKIKEAVTSPQLSIRKMRTDSFQVPNTTHWIQCANDINACPVFDGDTRITVIHVNRLKSEVPEKLMKDRLREEAPNYIRTLLNFDLPEYTGRLRIPAVETDSKRRAAEDSRTLLELFISDYCEEVEGHFMTFAEFYEAFSSFITSLKEPAWTRQLVSRRWPVHIRLYNGKGNIKMIDGIRLKEST